jgi:XTP/dITP diphosphohydrolase
VKLLFATNNVKKRKELEALVQGLALEVVTPADMKLVMDVDEDGQTFAANAEKKARAFAKATGLWSLADDSGLCVDALGGAPGIRSARYAPGTDQDRCEKLLAALKDVPDSKRQAHFACVLCLCSPEREVFFEEGRCDGEIARQLSGTAGFGYDPVFFVPSLEKTMAELTPEQKNRLSHRGLAFSRLRPRLEALASDA